MPQIHLFSQRFTLHNPILRVLFPEPDFTSSFGRTLSSQNGHISVPKSEPQSAPEFLKNARCSAQPSFEEALKTHDAWAPENSDFFDQNRIDLWIFQDS